MFMTEKKIDKWSEEKESKINETIFEFAAKSLIIPKWFSIHVAENSFSLF